MGNLPVERVQYVHPFYKVGVDYCGPFKVHTIRRRGQSPVKVYVCIFVCLSTKAVHIEMVGNLSTESFLGALSWFTSRRGNCHTICSDNGTSFVGANNDLRELFQFLASKASNITAALQKYKIEWKFIPPGAPHMGGIWEAAVKQAKIHLGRVIGESLLTMEEFSTLLTKIEAISNSRPVALAQVDDIDYITPAHFLIGRTFVDIAEDDVTNIKITPNARWRMVKLMYQHFWKRWHTDYLAILQKRKKWNTEVNNLTIGDVVLVAETNLPSTCWALARIIGIHPGDDGKVRVVTLRLANTKKIIQRPLQKLCKLPIEHDESGDSWPAEC